MFSGEVDAALLPATRSFGSSESHVQSGSNSALNSDQEERISLLEAQVEALRTELDELKRQWKELVD
ncbi:MAG: DUF5320 domain-containing protein [Colwellia sp.]|nr:DUF5320 domain-containing protein [Colwellia sp.]